MTYFEGFVIAVPTANRDRFITHAISGDGVFMDHGATRVVEAWQDDVARGETTDFFGAVDAKEDEAIVFSWMEWPDKAKRDAMTAKMDDLMKTDERFDPDKNPMPFDGARMIYGGFSSLFDEGAGRKGSYVQGFLLAVPEDRKDAYREMAALGWDFFRANGALRHVEAWQDDVPEGKQTDFYRAVKAQPGEKVVFSFIEWPSREACDAASEKMATGEGMEMPEGGMPFDGKRMMWGGFTPVVELGS